MASGGGRHDSALSLTKVKTIMKSSPDSESINHESVVLMAWATEMFTKRITSNSLENKKHGKKLDYDDVAEYVADSPELEFISEILPKKMKAKECLQQIKADDSSN